jgi:hypothetical protein
LRAAEWPDDEHEYLSDEYDEARHVRDELVRYLWSHAAESLHQASMVVGRYPWLADWARPRVEANADYAEELRRLFASFIQPEYLVDAAAVHLMPEPVTSGGSEQLAALGDTEKAVRELWRDWQHRASTSWKRLEDHALAVWTVLRDAMGNKRKGRDEAEQGLRELVGQWSAAARSSAETTKSADRRWLVATIPGDEDRRGYPRRRAFDSIVTDWHLAVLAVFAETIDWSRRVALLHVPDLIARRLLDGDADLPCHEIDQLAGDPRAVLADWVEQNLGAPEVGILPGVLDDTPISQRRIVCTSDLVALRDTNMGDLPYLVFSAETGVEVLHPTTVAKRAASGWRGVIVAGPADVPGSLISPWAEKLMSSATDDDNYGDDRLDLLGVPAGERSLVSPQADRREVEFILRVLAIVRSAPDLRAGGRTGLLSAHGAMAGVASSSVIVDP